MKPLVMLLISLFCIGCVAPSRLGVRYKGEMLFPMSDRMALNPNINISVNPLTDEDIPYDIDILKNKFETYVHKNADLEGLLKKFPDLKINMEVTPHEKIQRTWILDIAFFCPFYGCLLPYTPWWGNVNLDAKLTISIPGRIFEDFKFQTTESFNIKSYPYYKAGKILTNKYSIAYNHIFEQVSAYKFTEFVDKTNGITPIVSTAPHDSASNQLNSIGKDKMLTTVYSRSYFRATFMNLFATIAGTAVAIGAGVKYGTTHNFTKNDADAANGLMELNEAIAESANRKNSSEYEKKMGDFSVLSYFDSLFYGLNGSIKDFKIEMTGNKNDNARILNRLESRSIDKDTQFTAELNSSNYKYISAFNFQYGIGARAGGEQFGFTKKYRPYVRIDGMIKDVKTNKLSWSNNIIVFSNIVYHGKKEAEEANISNLIEEFKIISERLARLVIDDMNGKKYTYKEYLVE
jgi:hypothetical protein